MRRAVRRAAACDSAMRSRWRPATGRCRRRTLTSARMIRRSVWSGRRCDVRAPWWRTSAPRCSRLNVSERAVSRPDGGSSSEHRRKPPVPGADGRTRRGSRDVGATRGCAAPAGSAPPLSMTRSSSTQTPAEPWRWSSNSAALSAFLMSQGHKWRIEESKSSSPTGRAPRPPWTPACPTPATCWTASQRHQWFWRWPTTPVLRRACGAGAGCATGRRPRRRAGIIARPSEAAPERVQCPGCSECTSSAAPATPSRAPIRPASTPSLTRRSPSAKRPNIAAGTERYSRARSASTCQSTTKVPAGALGRPSCDLVRPEQLPEYHDTVRAPSHRMVRGDPGLGRHTDRASDGRIERNKQPGVASPGRHRSSDAQASPTQVAGDLDWA